MAVLSRLNHVTFCCFLLFCAITIAPQRMQAQDESDQLKLSWEFQETDSDASLRGLCVVDEKIVWASGTGGTVLRTDDAGVNWQNVSPPDCDELDFRDVHAFDADNAVIINAGQPAVFYRTNDGGKSWTQVFEHKNKASFFDAVAAINSDHLIAMSDPVDDRILLVESLDAGLTWSELPSERRPEKLSGEAGFAASGSNMIVDPANSTIYLALGSAEEGAEHATSRIVVSGDAGKTWKPIICPVKRTQSSGIFSICCLTGYGLVAVGGDYVEPADSASNIAVILFNEQNKDEQNESLVPEKKPGGYRSGVTFSQLQNEQILLVTVGTSGGDYSLDKGVSWQPFSEESLHGVKSTGTGTIWASGGDGRIAKLRVKR